MLTEPRSRDLFINSQAATSQDNDAEVTVMSACSTLLLVATWLPTTYNENINPIELTSVDRSRFSPDDGPSPGEKFSCHVLLSVNHLERSKEEDNGYPQSGLFTSL